MPYSTILLLLGCSNGPPSKSAPPPFVQSIFDSGTTLPVDDGVVVGFVGNVDGTEGDEILSSDLSTGTVVLYSAGLGGFSSPVEVPSIDGQLPFGYSFPVASDVTGDGSSELLMRGRSADSEVNGILAVSVPAGVPTGTTLIDLSGDPSIASSARCPGYAPVGDVDGDGFDDVALVSYADRQLLLYSGPLAAGTPVGEFDIAKSFSSLQLELCDIASPGGSAESADLSGDGLDDIVASSLDGRAAVFDRTTLSEGERGAFALFRGMTYEAAGIYGSYADAAGTRLPVPADLDGDHSPDILAVGASQGGDYGSFSGVVYLWCFEAGGETDAEDSEALVGEVPNVYFGAALAARSGDAGSDLIVGSLGTFGESIDEADPVAVIFTASDHGLSESATLSVTEGVSGPYLALTSGDFDGDVREEFLYSAPDGTAAVLLR